MNSSGASTILCPNCLGRGYCRYLKLQLINDTQVSNPEYIRDLRAFAYALGVNDEDWREFLNDLYRDYPGRIMNAGEKEVFLDMSEFERPSIREWFRDYCCTPCPDNVIPRVRCEARERVRILATILKAHYPIEAMMWGVRGANDNRSCD